MKPETMKEKKKGVFLGVSTSWLGDSPKAGEEILQHLKDLDIDGVEINYRTSEEAFLTIKKNIKNIGLKVFSLHNFVPVPPEVSFFKASGDIFNLASQDAYERELAIKYCCKTIEHASDMDGATVVIHCGKIDMDPEWHIIKSLDEHAILDFLKQKLEERNSLRFSYMDALKLSLDKVLNFALKYQIKIAAENRYSYHELPQLEDFKILFDEFDGAPIVYWHDVGHDYVNANLNIIKQNEMLSNFNKQLSGFHIHDVLGLEDHLPIGKGEINFYELLPLTTSMPYIIELKPGTPTTEVSSSIEKLKIILEKKINENKQDN